MKHKCGALIDRSDADIVREYDKHGWYVPTSGGWKGYAVVVIRLRDGKRKAIVMHRLIMGAKRGQHVDHINGNPLDNRRSNLRFCDKAGNSQNIRSSKNQKNGGYKGVFPMGLRWRAQIGITRGGQLTQIHLGCFADPKDAARAYDVAARKLFGRFAAPNFSEQS